MTDLYCVAIAGEHRPDKTPFCPMCWTSVDTRFFYADRAAFGAALSTACRAAAEGRVPRTAVAVTYTRPVPRGRSSLPTTTKSSARPCGRV